MTQATKRYADGSQKDKKWRQRHNLLVNSKANFHHPRASIKSRERQEFKTKLVRGKLAEALALSDYVRHLNEANEDAKTE